MKTRGLFLSALLMGAVMAGCSNEEVMDIDNGKSLKKSDNYIAVNIVAPTNMSRGTEGDFMAGSEKENAVNNAMFVFYNANGSVVDAVPATLEWNEGSGSVEKVSSAMIVLSNPSTWPTQVVALLNTSFTELQLEGMSLTQLKNLQADYSSTTAFVMSNSVYKSGDNIISATPLADTNICSSETAALANPVSIPVERVLAKIEANINKNFQILEPEVAQKLNGTNVKFIPTITGMALIETNPESYLLKNIDNITGWEGWNDAANWRTYWANSAIPTKGYQSLSWNTISGSNANSFSGYCLENTSATATKLLVTAQFKAEGAETFETIIKYNGTYYTVDGLKNYFNTQYFADIKHSNDNSNEWRTYMDFVSAGTENEWEVKLVLTNAPTPNDETVNLASILQKINNKTMSQWTDGKCYYFVDIEHFGPKGYQVGVVRNHWYQLSLNSIKGLGTPVFDPSVEITPDKPEEENYYVAAEVKILKWKIVSQNVALQ